MKNHQMRNVEKLVALTCLLPVIGLATAFGQERNESAVRAFRVISTTTDPSVTSPLRKIDTVIQVGSDARNRFTMHRTYKPGRRGNHRGSIILLPSLICSFREYMINESHDPMQSLAATLALADYAVYGYSPRTSNLQPNACSSGIFDCSVMKDWGFNAYLEEIDYIRRQVVDLYDDEKPAIGGLSLGGMLGVASVNAKPSGYSGLLLWDAMLYSTDPSIAGLNAAICSQLNGAIAAGIYYDESLPNGAKQVAQLGEFVTVQVFGSPTPSLGTPTFTNLRPTILTRSLSFHLFHASSSSSRPQTTSSHCQHYATLNVPLRAIEPSQPT